MPRSDLALIRSVRGLEPHRRHRSFIMDEDEATRGRMRTMQADGADAQAAIGPTHDRTDRSGASRIGLRRPRDWAWRRRIRANASSLRVYRVVVGTLGALIVVTGLALVPLPGPGWLIVFVGVSIWASEFAWARRLHKWGMAHLHRWNDWIMGQGLWIRGGVAVLTCVFVNAVLWVSLKLTGIPGWAPDGVEAFMRTYLHL